MGTVSGKITTKTSVHRADIPKKWAEIRSRKSREFRPIGETLFSVKIFNGESIPNSFIVLEEDMVLQSVNASIMMKESILEKYNIDLDCDGIE